MRELDKLTKNGLICGAIGVIATAVVAIANRGEKICEKRKKYDDKIISCDSCGGKMTKTNGVKLKKIVANYKHDCPVALEVFESICAKLFKDADMEKVVCNKCKSEIKNKIKKQIDKALDYENVDFYSKNYYGKIRHDPNIIQEICTDWYSDKDEVPIVLRQLAAVGGFDVVYDCKEERKGVLERKDNHITGRWRLKGAASHKI